MKLSDRGIILKDSTMREGLDVPGVTLDVAQKRLLLARLSAVGVPEAEIVAPGHFDRDISHLMEIGNQTGIKTSGLIYGNSSGWVDQLKQAHGLLGRFDILMPLSEFRAPFAASDKKRQMVEVLQCTLDMGAEAGVGFPHATQVETGFLLEMCQRAVKSGARRITLYDTNGSSDPWSVWELVTKVRTVASEIQICFHAHNDLGMATANSVAAALAGADCLDVTVNGLGDRAGNASLEQVAVALHLKKFALGVHLDQLKGLSALLEGISHVPVSQLAPIVGAFVFCQKSPSHLERPELFEAFDPALIGAKRSISKE